MERKAYLDQDLYTLYLDFYFHQYFLPMLGIVQMIEAMREFKRRIEEQRRDDDDA